MTYIDAFFDKQKERIHVVERIDGTRVFKEYRPDYVFYYEDQNGTYKSIFGNPLKRFSTHSFKEFTKEVNSTSKQTFESDINPIFRCLADNYTDANLPELNLGFFDIEVDFDPKHGFASPDDPFNKITAISLYLSEYDKLICLALPPKTLTYDEAMAEIEGIPDTLLFDDERDLLTTFLELVKNADVMSGWNSTKFDIPYIVNRIERVLGKDFLKQLCLWEQYPKKRTFLSFKKEVETYDLVGRVHLDYLELYQKYSPGELHSYRLDYVGEIEIGENKIPYDGTLDQLYNKDFKKFILYSRQDTLMLKKIDDKNKFIDLANALSHANLVLFDTTKGSVQLIEQAIIKEAHALGLIVPDKNRELFGQDQDPVAGAYVADPKIGRHDWIGSVDINSLYPSTIRTFNMSPETLIGQVRQSKTEKYIRKLITEDKMSGTTAWGTLFTTLEYDDIINKTNNSVTIDFVDGNSFDMTGAEAYTLIFESDQPWCITANGTLFRTDKEGIIPHVLSKWYSDRQSMQKMSKTLSKIGNGLTLDEELIKKLEA